MSTPTIVDRSVQDFQAWIGEIKRTADLADEQRAYDALRGVLHTLRDRLPANETTDLGAELPTLVRGVYYEGYAPQKTPETTRSVSQFLDALDQRVGQAPEFDHGAAAMAVFACLDKHLDAGQVDHVILALPKDVQELWPEEARNRAQARHAA